MPPPPLHSFPLLLGRADLLPLYEMIILLEAELATANADLRQCRRQLEQLTRRTEEP